jgi:hypothetical protein
MKVFPDDVREIKAITPQQAKAIAITQIPDFVIGVVNDLIIKKISPNSKNPSCYIKQDEIVNEIMKAVDGTMISRQQVFDNHWLDFEPIFEASGWKVDFDKPGYNEDYDAVFKFSTKE